MKTKNIMIALTLLTTGTAWAEDFPKDSLKIVDIEEDRKSTRLNSSHAR